MRICEVIGTVTLNRWHPTLAGGRFKLAVPLTLEDLEGQGDRSSEMLVVYDELGVGVGSRIAVSEGREAAMPFYPDDKPLDAYNAAILDNIHLHKTKKT
ncbi:MAG: carbon dioxide concentrating mechanism protein CcmL [Pirellulales bacterium]|nr:carbon dioxide concentrating mechanism protein CcmL [Pirellulales bacterium]